MNARKRFFSVYPRLLLISFFSSFVFAEIVIDGKLSEEELVNGIKKIFDLKPMGIIDTLQLKNPIYSKFSAYGHFGRNDSPWENIDKVEQLKEYFKLEEIGVR